MSNRKFTDTVHYHLLLTTKYMDKMIAHLLGKVDAKITFDEFVILDILATKGPMCQRDVAKIILRDRANTGRLAGSLAQKGYIVIKSGEKNNRLVKNLELTELGKNYSEKLKKELKNLVEEFSQFWSVDEEKKLIETLINFRGKIQNVIDMQI